jgi:predicted RNA-binding Zn-ribbon protein involved in translation (DUF1610 family)
MDSAALAYVHVLEGEIADLRTTITDLQHFIDELRDLISVVTHRYLWNCFVCDRNMLVSYGDSTWYECPNCEEPIHICDDCNLKNPELLAPVHAYDCGE